MLVNIIFRWIEEVQKNNTTSVHQNLSHFPFPSVPQNLSYFTFTIFGSGPYIPLIHSYSYFIIKLIYKSRTHNPLTFSTHFPLHFLKPVLGQSGTNLVDGGSINHDEKIRAILFSLRSVVIIACDLILWSWLKFNFVKLNLILK